MGKSSGSAEKSKNRLRKHQEKHESEREKMRDDAVVEVSMNSVLDLRPEDEEREELPPVDKGKGKAGVEVPVNGDLGEDSGENSEVEEQERRFAEKKRKGKGKVKDQGAVKPFAQRDLVSLAFAGDKVVQVCFVPRYFTQIVIPHFFVHRTSKKPNTERFSKMHQRKWTQHYLDGCALFPICQHPHFRAALGLMGWDWYEKSTTETIPCQEGLRRRSPFSARLRESTRYHL